MTRARTIAIGVAHWHVPLYAPTMSQAHEMIGASDPNPSAVTATTDQWGLTATPDWRMLLELENIELAYVFGPHIEMPAICAALIERRIPFVVEKPAGVDQASLVALAEAARAAGVPATVPLVQRGAPVDAWLAKAGRPIYQRISFIAGPPRRYLDNGNPWMLDPAAAGGGCLANLGPHFVDLFLHAADGGAVTVDSRLQGTLHGAAIEDHASLLLTTTDGREAIVEVGYAFPGSPLKRECSFTRAGELGYASISTEGRALFTANNGTTESTELDVDSDWLYEPYVRDIARTLGDGFRGLPTLDDLERTMDVIWTAYGSTRSDTAIRTDRTSGTASDPGGAGPVRTDVPVGSS